MPLSLNFSKKDNVSIKAFLEKFEKLETKTSFEEARAKILETTITLYNSGKVSIQGKNEEKAKELLLKEIHGSNELVFGIDETGRSELTGPMVVAGVLGKTSKLRELRDSKKTSNVFEKAKIVEKNSLATAIISFNPEFIDFLRNNGMNLNQIECHSINSFAKLFKQLAPNAKIVVDGSKIAECDSGIEFLVKGDDLEPVIGAASVIAKKAREESANKSRKETWKLKKEE